MLRKNKITVVLSDEERNWLDKSRANHFAEGRPISISGLIRELMFDDSKKQLESIDSASSSEAL